MAGFKLFLIAIFQLAGYVVCQEPPNLVSFGDFMEFDVGLHKACENVAGGSNTTWGIIRAFENCTHSLTASRPHDNFEALTGICQNRGKYLECWDKMKADAKKVCGSDKESHLPAVYQATVTSFCSDDNGAKTIEILKKALTEITPDAQQSCPEETGIHWIENCSSLLENMSSSDLCARHGAIAKCLEKITCDNIKFAKLMRQVYTDSRPHLKCNA